MEVQLMVNSHEFRDIFTNIIYLGKALKEGDHISEAVVGSVLVPTEDGEG
jgi:hypothetical protein